MDTTLSPRTACRAALAVLHTIANDEANPAETRRRAAADILRHAARLVSRARIHQRTQPPPVSARRDAPPAPPGTQQGATVEPPSARPSPRHLTSLPSPARAPSSPSKRPRTPPDEHPSPLIPPWLEALLNQPSLDTPHPAGANAASLLNAAGTATTAHPRAP